MINSPVTTLKITEEEWENCTELNGLTGLAVQLGQFYLTRNFKKLLGLIASEFLFLLLGLVFFVPISLMILRSMDLLPRHPQGIQFVLFIFAGIIVGSVFVFNVFLWRYQRRFKSLARLLLEIEKYNCTLDAIAVLDSLNHTQFKVNHSKLDLSLHKRDEILKVLQTTRQSLIDGLKIERILRQNQQILTEGYELIANLEAACLTLTAVEVRDRASEYSQIINDALSINLAIQREMSRLIR
ncbi:MAG: hypothetical protein ACLFT0_05145 [Spirulinaceae cyanobacterium]